MIPKTARRKTLSKGKTFNQKSISSIDIDSIVIENKYNAYFNNMRFSIIVSPVWNNEDIFVNCNKIDNIIVYKLSREKKKKYNTPQLSIESCEILSSLKEYYGYNVGDDDIEFFSSLSFPVLHYGLSTDLLEKDNIFLLGVEENYNVDNTNYIYIHNALKSFYNKHIIQFYNVFIVDNCDTVLYKQQVENLPSGLNIKHIFNNFIADLCEDESVFLNSNISIVPVNSNAI